MIKAHSEVIKNRIVTAAILSDESLLANIESAADICEKALRNGNKIMFCGNGGSAADAQHLAAELVGKLNVQRPPLAGLALTTDTSVLTAIGNDYSFKDIFSRQIHAMGKSGDVLIALSTSGNSTNVLNAIHTARSQRITTIGMTGEIAGGMNSNCHLLIRIPSIDTQRIQEAHIMLGHIILGIVEERIYPK